jgi:hypothetical protein
LRAGEIAREIAAAVGMHRFPSHRATTYLTPGCSCRPGCARCCRFRNARV